MLAIDAQDIHQMALAAPRAMELMGEELCYFRLLSFVAPTDEQLNFIRIASAKTNNFWLSIPESDLSSVETIASLRECGIKRLSIRLDKLENIKKRKYSGIGNNLSGDLSTVFRWKHYLAELPFDLAPEISIDDENIDLAPTAAQLLQTTSPWIIFNVQGNPTKRQEIFIGSAFEYLKIRGLKSKFIFFPFSLPNRLEWNLKTLNSFCGPTEVHLDISNRCTHSCVFCGLYGPDALEEQKKSFGGVVSPEVRAVKSMIIDSAKCLEIIASLPPTTELIQFGGVGDPLTHPNAIDFIAAARKRGFHVGVLSNLEYIDETSIIRLNEYGGIRDYDLKFFVNISGATEETYRKTRPKQSAAVFKNVISNIKSFSLLRDEYEGRGANFTLQIVVNALNFHEVHLYPDLAFESGAKTIYWKPMEVHVDWHRKYVIPESRMREYAQLLAKGLARSDQLGIVVFMREIAEGIVKKYA